ncbi:DNA primase [Marinobacterium jannaschii]|uniref:DNA primase n=1 Tax=Marinobacterium jannaschii TaxID=64970 RepID=UPI0004815F57|nr:DNA primase [Marinobacterium jannaschii]
MAGRIPQHFIDDLLARVNIIDVLDGRVNKLKRTGKNYSGLCPFHKEKTPSFTANQEKQFYYCFGCGAGGNALGFLMEYERLDFPQAIEELAKMVGMEVPREQSSPQSQQKDRHLKDLYQLLESSADFFAQQLRSHHQRSDAVNYLKQRGLNGQIAKAFGIGYAPPGWDNLMRELADSPEQTRLLEKAGMLIHKEERNSYYDRFRNRIMFPIRDQRGRVIAFGGRVLGDEKPKYLNSPETDTFNKSRELYGLYEARKHSNKLERLIIVEGYMDVVGLAQFGIHYAVATLGTAATKQHLERLFKLVPEVIFCFDGDEAGRKAARRALDTALPVIADGQEARFLFLPEGEDPDTLVRKEGRDGFEQRQQESLPMSEFFFKCHSEHADLTSMDGRARFSKEALPALREMKPGILQQMMLDKVCDITGLSLEQLQSVANLQQATQTAIKKTEPKPDIPQIYQPPAYDDGYDDYPANDYDYPEPDNYSIGYDSPASPPGRQPERQLHNRGSGKKVRSLALSDRIISLLLHFPALAKSCPLPAELPLLPEPNISLLIELSEYLCEDPQATLGTLGVDWQDGGQRSQYLQKLNEITWTDPVDSEEQARQILADALKVLEQRIDEQRLEALKRKPALTQSEKQLLNTLLLKRLKPGD